MSHPKALHRSLFFFLTLYGVSTLISQAVMSTAAAFLFVVIASSALAFILKLSSRRIGRSLWSPSPWWLYLELSGALVLSIVASLLGAALFPLEYGGQSARPPQLWELAKVWYFFWPPLLAWGLRRLSAQQAEKLLWIWFGFAGVLGCVGVAQYWTGWPRPQVFPQASGAPVRYHATLFLGHHLSVASIFIFPFFWGLDRLKDWSVAWRVRSVSWAKLSLLVAALFAILICLIFTFSRTLWVGLPLGLTVWSVLRLRGRARWGLVAGVALVLILSLQFSQVRDRVQTAMGIGPRMELWKANWEFFKQRPMTGVGWLRNEELSGYYLKETSGRNTVFAGRAHNNALEILAQLGMVGFAVWVMWSLWITIRFYRLGRYLGHWGWFCAWIVFQVNGLTQVNQWEGKVLHQLCWALAWSGFLWARFNQKSNAR